MQTQVQQSLRVFLTTSPSSGWTPFGRGSDGRFGLLSLVKTPCNRRMNELETDLTPVRFGP
jgi:hypothetical protein